MPANGAHLQSHVEEVPLFGHADLVLLGILNVVTSSESERCSGLVFFASREDRFCIDEDTNSSIAIVLHFQRLLSHQYIHDHDRGTTR